MKYLGSTNIFEAPVQLNSAPTDVSHAVNVSWVQSAAIMDIHPDSQVHAETILHNGEKKLKLKSLAITDVEVESVSASIAAWAAANYTGTEKQEGDIVILTNTGGRPETWIHAGGTAGDETDFIEITGSDVQASEVRAFLSAGFGLNYNVGTGEFSANNGDIRSLFSGDSAISYDSANGAFSWVGDTDNVSEGASNLYFTDARARLAISALGPVQYDNLTGQISLNASTDDIAEGSKLYFTDARARLALSEGSGNDFLKYDNATGSLEVAKSSFRQEFTAVNLTANVWQNMVHNLGERIVHVSAYDANGEKIQLDVKLVDATTCQVKAAINQNGLDIVVSI